MAVTWTPGPGPTNGPDIGTSNAAADILNGFGGNDTLNGGAGTDILNGGAGADTFVYNTAAQSRVGLGLRDTITDFTSGVDTINLTEIYGGSLTYIGANAFNGIGQVRYQGGLLQANLFGNTNPDLEVQLAGGATLVAGDLVLA